jgi:hypothetical protein
VAFLRDYKSLHLFSPEFKILRKLENLGTHEKLVFLPAVHRRARRATVRGELPSRISPGARMSRRERQCSFAP